MTVVHDNAHTSAHTYERFLKLSVGLCLDLGLVFVRTFTVLIGHFCAFFSGVVYTILFLCCLLLLC